MLNLGQKMLLSAAQRVKFVEFRKVWAISYRKHRKSRIADEELMEMLYNYANRSFPGEEFGSFKAFFA